jgi:hypothetical protein
MATKRQQPNPAGEPVELTGGRNIEATLEGNCLTIRINIDEDLGPSVSGKTHCVAATDGLKYAKINGQNWTLNLGLFKPVNRTGR